MADIFTYQVDPEDELTIDERSVTVDLGNGTSRTVRLLPGSTSSLLLLDRDEVRAGG